MTLFIKIISLATLIYLVGCNTQIPSQPTSHKQVYQIIFQGKTVGRLTHETLIINGLIQNKETLELKTQFRGANSVTSLVTETHEESLDGKVVGYRKEYESPNAKRQLSGRLQNGKWHWKVIQGEQQELISVDMPDNFLLHQGLQEQMKNKLHKKEKFIYSGWNENLQKFESIQLDVININSQKNRWEILQSYPGSSKPSHSYWVNNNFQLVESNINYSGYQLLVLPCDANCETKSLTAIRPLDHQMLPSPYQITDDALKGHIRYQITSDHFSHIPSSIEQKAKRLDAGWQLDVCGTCGFTQTESAPDLPEFLKDNIWLDIDNPLLIKAVDRAVNNTMTVDEKMKKLVKITRHRLQDNLQFQGYATASQAYKSHSGDCTEYALLLASFGRIAKIPTRILFGLSYSHESFHGKRDMYAPHAWVQAWVDGQWKSYDAGMEHFDAGHIALMISDGNKQDFHEMTKKLTGFKIISSQQVVKRKQ